MIVIVALVSQVGGRHPVAALRRFGHVEPGEGEHLVRRQHPDERADEVAGRSAHLDVHGLAPLPA
jgi:hypothetical protein